jgi:hypothetical protein
VEVKNMNKKTFTAIALLFTVLVGFQLATPVTADKTIDNGSKITNGGSMKVEWIAVMEGAGNNRLRISIRTFKESNGNWTITSNDRAVMLQKINNRIKLTYLRGLGNVKSVKFVSYNGNAIKYYHSHKNALINQLMRNA